VDQKKDRGHSALNGRFNRKNGGESKGSPSRALIGLRAEDAGEGKENPKRKTEDRRDP